MKEDDLGTMNIPRSRSRLGIPMDDNKERVTHDKKIFGHDEYFNPSTSTVSAYYYQ